MLPYKKDLSKQTFGRWKVLSYSHKVQTRSFWNCRCQCGTERAIAGPELVRGMSKSCGCLASELRLARLTTHGMTGHPAHRIWVGARHRCRNPNDTGYYLYGGRGIRFSEAWDDFETFWAEMGPTWKPGMTLDRLDTDGDYEPGNCVWATQEDQANNRRNNRLIMTKWGVMTVAQAARKAGLKPVTVFSRIGYGWPEEDLLLPTRKRN